MPTSRSTKAIGGYFELTLSDSGQVPIASRVLLQSARAAFHLMLDNERPSRVWVPKYICDEMLSPLAMLGIASAFYSLDERLMPTGDIRLAQNEWLLYPNYFGICGENEDDVLARFPRSQVILDRSQALFARPKNCLASIYSPRKFVGLPDGGILESSLPLAAPVATDSGSVGRCVHLLKRLDGEPESGYSDFLRAEDSLSDSRPLRMSRITERIFASANLGRAKSRRSRNFSYLDKRLRALNSLKIGQGVEGPLCYPLLVDVPGVRDRLIDERIFVPTYWPSVLGRTAPGSFEHWLVTCCVPIPCDQRYGEADMRDVADVICRELACECGKAGREPGISAHG